MKNYKQALYNAIDESTNTQREYLSDYSQDFITDHNGESNQYICDAVSKFADGRASIYYYDIMQYIKDNPDDVNDAINEFGWDGCGCDIYKAGQIAEYMSIERKIYNDLEDIIKYITLDFIDSTDEANDEAERIWESLTEERKEELIDEFINNIEMIDNNSRFNEILDAYNDFVRSILDEEESDE